MDELNYNGTVGGSEAMLAASVPTYKMIALRGLVVFPGQTLHF